MYTDEVNGYMKVAHCSTANCQGGNVTLSIVDPNIGVSCYGEFPEMQMNPYTGFPALSYFNQTSVSSGSLKLALCLDVACQKAQVQVVATGKCGYGRDSRYN
jgi:hypothetical protein